MKKSLLLLLIPVLIFTFIGCGNKVQNNDIEITLQLNGIPHEVTTYDLKIYIRKDNLLLKIYSYTNQSVTQEFNEKISVTPDATSLTAYLYVGGTPKYFTYFDYSQTQKTYSSSYWIDYSLYFDSGTINWGISEDVAREVSPSFNGSIDFSKDGYYLFKVTNTLGKSISINFSSPDSPVCVSCSSSLGDLYYSEYSYYNNYSQLVTNCQSDVYYIFIRPRYLTAPLPTAQVNIYSINQISHSAKVTDMVAGNTPSVVYAVDNANKIFSINPLTQTIGLSYSLSVTPVSLTFSPVDNLLYILDESYGKFEIWNPVSNTSVNVVTFGVGYGDFGKKIQVLPNNNRIYVLIDDKLYVINKNSPYNTITSMTISNPCSMAIYEDGSNDKLFATRGNYPGSILEQYTFLSGTSSFSSVEATRNNSAGFYSKNLIMSPDKTKLVIPDCQASGFVNAYDTNDIAGAVLGQWNIGDYPRVACFSPDSSITYFVNADYPDELVIDVMDAANYSLIRKLALPNADDNPVITINQDGSKLVAFSGYNYTNYFIYFYENIKKSVSTQSTLIYPLNVKTIKTKLDSTTLRLENN